MNVWIQFFVFLIITIVSEIIAYKLLIHFSGDIGEGLIQECIIWGEYFSIYDKYDKVTDTFFKDVREKFISCESTVLKHGKCLLEADIGVFAIAGVVFSVLQIGFFAVSELVVHILFGQIGIEEDLLIMENIVKIIFIMFLCFMIYKFMCIYKKEKYCINMINMILEERKAGKFDNMPDTYEDDKQKMLGSKYDYSSRLNERKSKIWKNSLKYLGWGIIYYVVLTFFYWRLNLAIKLDDITIKELLAIFFVYLVSLIIMVILNIYIMLDNEKDVFSIKDVDSELQNIPIERYKEVLEKRSKAEVMEMYRRLYEVQRRKNNISLKSVCETMIAAFLPVFATKFMDYQKNASEYDIISWGIALIMLLPLLIGLVGLVFSIIEGDSIHKTNSLEKNRQDEIVRELANGYMR